MIAVEKWRHEDHWELVSSWVRARGLGVDLGDRDCYPHTGLVVGGIVAGWLYLTNSAMAWTGGFVSDPKAAKDHRRECIGVLIRQLTLWARQSHAHVVVAFPGPPSLADSFYAEGFDIDTRAHTYARNDLRKAGIPCL